MKRRPATVKVSPVLVPLLVANAGILLALFCGPNARHPVLPGAYVGAAFALAGLLGIVRALLLRRRDDGAAADMRR